MVETPEPRGHIASLAIAFESGLILLAVGIGWLLQRSPVPGVALDIQQWPAQSVAVGWGAVAALPMILALVIADRYPLGPLRNLQRAVDEKILPWLREWTILDMALVSLAAGLGEEMLFRGLLQTALADMRAGTAGMVGAVVLASVVFGVCHYVTTSYAVIAALMGAYLGGLLLLTDNLLAPIIAHAAYDFAALVYLNRIRRDSR